MEFRKARKGGYVHMSCGYDYVEKADTEIKEKVMPWIEAMLPEKEDSDEMLIWLSRPLKGEGNDDEIAVFLIGEAPNNIYQLFCL